MQKLIKIMIMIICIFTTAGCSVTVKHGNDIEKYEDYLLKVKHSRPFCLF